MTLHPFFLVVLAATLYAGEAAAQRTIKSMYTDLAGSSCRKTADEKISGASTSTCPGIGGFGLHVLTDDERSSISVVAPGGRISALEYWDVVTHGFSTLEKRAEWRVRVEQGKPVPIAVIVRVNSVDQSEPDHPKIVQLLAVAKIGDDMACVIEKIDSRSPNAGQRARTSADRDDWTCLQGKSKPR